MQTAERLRHLQKQKHRPAPKLLIEASPVHTMFAREEMFEERISGTTRGLA